MMISDAHHDAPKPVKTLSGKSAMLPQESCAMARETRKEKLDLRLTLSAKRTLQFAASAVHRSVSEFVLESALARAEETLPDRRRFGLNAKQWAAFQAALEAPPRAMPGLEKLLREPSIFERARE
jgi:uncharacterized protein (DUF1778 family)